RVSHLVHPRRASDAVRGICRASELVVAQADRVTDLVCDDELQQSAHKGIGHGEAARARIHLRGLSEVPVALKVEHVLEDAHGAIQYLASARIADVRANGIL